MKKHIPFIISLLAMVLISSCSPKLTKSFIEEKGMASYYASHFHGKKTASGEIYKKEKLTAAHRHLPFGTKVKVTNLNNGKSVNVIINDRGPFVKGRIIDVSGRAAQNLGMIQEGIVPVIIYYSKK
ncbi:septal ring lytic transglycosylase RlpA family protein [Echinicola jeungdonensis]|uniref:Probable endolytic peptidoglycan transglycosylase RlpA n=1 Tax=Echinicola jeungdonensis TaxID=709343 RepID=A0ABV5J252_9BACT|nr:septal ring lytic transglycosylase RlpA family protein [Echinicola jeungdonensis]MDN3668422.1 septal ring lytic transglycosylase RlpA family protein [Echinicola jeungdonensis]